MFEIGTTRRKVSLIRINPTGGAATREQFQLETQATKAKPTNNKHQSSTSDRG